MKIHKGLSQERWNTFSLFMQLANVGTDIERTIRWKEQGNKEYSMQAFERAFELLDMTVADPKNKGHRRKELLRVREALADHFVFDKDFLFFWSGPSTLSASSVYAKATSDFVGQSSLSIYHLKNWREPDVACRVGRPG